MRPAVASFMLLLTFPAAADFSPPKIIAGANGACSVLVNGTDVGCDGKALHTVLLNGHHIVNFATKDLAIVGFAGSNVLRIDPKSPTLAVEHVYLSNNQYEADGQCSFSTETSDDRSFTKVECKAILRDGRKVSGVLDGKSDGLASNQTMEAGKDTDPEGRPESGCEKTIRLHGLLSRAQFQCGYRKYSNILIAASSVCSKQIGEAAAKDKIIAGFHDFDTNEKEEGHAKICSELLKSFPNYVRK